MTFLGLIAHHDALPPEVRLLAITGFLGGLTTFSTFLAETVTLLLRRENVRVVYAKTGAEFGMTEGES